MKELFNDVLAVAYMPDDEQRLRRFGDFIARWYVAELADIDYKEVLEVEREYLSLHESLDRLSYVVYDELKATDNLLAMTHKYRNVEEFLAYCLDESDFEISINAERGLRQ